jgi:hypothetical protein
MHLCFCKEGHLGPERLGCSNIDQIIAWWMQHPHTQSQVFGSFERILSHHVFEFVYILPITLGLWKKILDDYHELC